MCVLIGLPCFVFLIQYATKEEKGGDESQIGRLNAAIDQVLSRGKLAAEVEDEAREGQPEGECGDEAVVVFSQDSAADLDGLATVPGVLRKFAQAVISSNRTWSAQERGTRLHPKPFDHTGVAPRYYFANV